MSSSIAALLEAAQQHFHAGRHEAAAQLLHDVVAADPSNGDALEGLAYLARTGAMRRRRPISSTGR